MFTFPEQRKNPNMADDADRAQERIENVIEGGIAIARDKAAHVRALVPCNACYYCEGYVSTGWVFCDANCQNDYYHELRRKEANGL